MGCRAARDRRGPRQLTSPKDWVPPYGRRYGVVKLTRRELELSRKGGPAFYRLIDPEWDARVLNRFAQAMAVVAYVAETDRQGLWPITISRFDAILAKLWPWQRAFVESIHPTVAWIRR